MLTKIVRRFASNFKTYDNLQELNRFLKFTKPNHTVVYFRANWNPQCQQSDKDIQKLAATNPGYQIIKVDSDVAPKIAKHYQVKAQPQYVFCLYGDQVIRQIGVDYNKLQEKVKKVDQLTTDVDFSDLPEKWVQYGTGYQAFYKQWVEQQYKWLVSDI